MTSGRPAPPGMLVFWTPVASPRTRLAVGSHSIRKAVRQYWLDALGPQQWLHLDVRRACPACPRRQRRVRACCGDERAKCSQCSQEDESCPCGRDRPHASSPRCMRMRTLIWPASLLGRRCMNMPRVRPSYPRGNQTTRGAPNRAANARNLRPLSLRAGVRSACTPRRMLAARRLSRSMAETTETDTPHPDRLLPRRARRGRPRPAAVLRRPGHERHAEMDRRRVRGRGRHADGQPRPARRGLRRHRGQGAPDRRRRVLHGRRPRGVRARLRPAGDQGQRAVRRRLPALHRARAPADRQARRRVRAHAPAATRSRTAAPARATTRSASRRRSRRSRPS